MPSSVFGDCAAGHGTGRGGCSHRSRLRLRQVQAPDPQAGHHTEDRPPRHSPSSCHSSSSPDTPPTTRRSGPARSRPTSRPTTPILRATARFADNAMTWAVYPPVELAETEDEEEKPVGQPGQGDRQAPPRNPEPTRPAPYAAAPVDRAHLQSHSLPGTGPGPANYHLTMLWAESGRRPRFPPAS